MTDRQTDRQSKKFRIANAMILLTYKNWQNKTDLKDFLETKRPIEKIIICHESGDPECPYEHTHVAVKFEREFQSRSERCLDFNGVHPHIKVLRNSKAFNDAVFYCEKEDQEPLSYGIDTAGTIETRVEEIIHKDSVLDAIKSCKSMAEVLATIQIYNLGQADDERHEKYLEELKNAPFRDYQQEWYDLLIKQDSRTILWIYDEVGNIGKSWFVNKMFAMHTKDVFMMTGKIADNGYRFRGQQFVLYDLQRTIEDYVSYGAIEELKNGRAISGKYFGNQRVYAWPHIVVFANFPPDRYKMSLDRWMVIRCEKRDGDPIGAITNIKYRGDDPFST